MKNWLWHIILHPDGWLCRFRPHKDERVPEVVMRGIDPDYDFSTVTVYMCERCGRFRTQPKVGDVSGDHQQKGTVQEQVVCRLIGQDLLLSPRKNGINDQYHPGKVYSFDVGGARRDFRCIDWFQPDGPAYTIFIFQPLGNTAGGSRKVS
jgi:hypothetical protein